MATVIGLDLGTTTCKAVALSPSGEVLATGTSGYSLRYPQPGWVEQKTADLWQGTIEALQAIVEQLPDHTFSALGVSGAMHSLLPVGQDGSALAPAMTWADNRAAPLVPALRAETDPHALYLRTGCPLRSTYHIPRLRWWGEQGILSDTRFRCFAALKDWILYHLTGIWATDHSLASATGLLDLRQCIWDKEALQLAGIAAHQLPPLLSPGSILGSLSAEVAGITGLPGDLPVIAGASDGALANLGAGAVGPGQITVTIGTSGAIRKMVATPQLDARERIWCYVLMEGQWFSGGAINNGGLAINWLRKQFYPDHPVQEGYRQLFEEAAAVPPGAEGLLFLPYFTGERSPHWTTESRGVLHGMGLEHGRGHIARAALEGVAFCLAEVWEALHEEGASPEAVRLTGGVTYSSLWSQIIADVLGVPLIPIEIADASAVGAAIMGHWVTGQIAEPDTLAGQIPMGRALHPEPERHQLYRERYRQFGTLYRRLWPATS